MECGQNFVMVNDTDWIIAHQDSPPYDCVLTIMNFGPEDVGEYNCAGLLGYKKDWSKTPIDLSVEGKRSNGMIMTIILVAIIIPIVTIVLVTVVLLAMFVLAYRVKKRRPTPIPEAVSPSTSEYTKKNIHTVSSVMTCCVCRSYKPSLSSTKLWCY